MKTQNQTDKATAKPLNHLFCHDAKARNFYDRAQKREAKRNAKLDDGVKRGEDFIAIRKSEHAALVAVAEAAQRRIDNPRSDKAHNDLAEALFNYRKQQAAVRGEGSAK